MRVTLYPCQVCTSRAENLLQIFHTKYLFSITSFNSHCVLWGDPRVIVCGWRNWGTESFNDSDKAPQRVSSRAGPWIQVSWPTVQGSVCCFPCHVPCKSDSTTSSHWPNVVGRPGPLGASRYCREGGSRTLRNFLDQWYLLANKKWYNISHPVQRIKFLKLM